MATEAANGAHKEPHQKDDGATIVSENHPLRTKGVLHELNKKAPGAMDAVRENAGDALERAASAGGEVYEHAQRAADQAGAAVRTQSLKLTTIIRRNPLLSVLIAGALGSAATLAATAPYVARPRRRSYWR